MGLRDLVTFDRLGDFWGIVRELNPDAIKGEAFQPLKIVVCGPAGVGKRAFASELVAGASDTGCVDVYDMPVDVPVALPAADLYLYLTSPGDEIKSFERNHVRQLLHRSGQLICLVLTDKDLSRAEREAIRDIRAAQLGLASDRVVAVGGLTPSNIADELGPALFAAVPHLALPVGRRLPLLRWAAADQIVRETSRVNAEFSAVSSLSGIVPIVGGLATAGADMVVLTKNQIMLLLKLAILHQRSVDDRLQVLAEMAPVVGAGFLWRTAARTLVSFLPMPLSIAPNIAVSYIGTYVVGKAAQYYYRVGQRPSPELLDRFRQEASNQLDGFAPIIMQLSRRFPLR
jgi:hypothetical protein